MQGFFDLFKTSRAANKSMRTLDPAMVILSGGQSIAVGCFSTDLGRASVSGLEIPIYVRSVAAMTRRSNTALVLMVGLLSACTSTSTPPTSDTPAAASSATTNATAGADDCGGTAAKVTAKLTGGKVTRVAVIGQCTTVSIETTLGDEDTTAATQLCTKAAEVAYSADTNSIRVHAKSGKELAQGISGARCLAAM
jgi:hypothetical protein